MGLNIVQGLLLLHEQSLSTQGVPLCRGSQTWPHMVTVGWDALKILIPKFYLQSLTSLVCFSFSSVSYELCALEHVINLCELSFLICDMGIIKGPPHQGSEDLNELIYVEH